MDGEKIKQLLELKQVRELISYFVNEAMKLDSVTDIKLDDPVEYAVEGKARKHAVEKIIEIMAPFMQDQKSGTGGIDKKEYAVEVKQERS